MAHYVLFNFSFSPCVAEFCETEMTDSKVAERGGIVARSYSLELPRGNLIRSDHCLAVSDQARCIVTLPHCSVQFAAGRVSNR